MMTARSDQLSLFGCDEPAPPARGLKRCTKCEEEKVLDAFPPHPGYATKRGPVCRSCTSTAAKLVYQFRRSAAFRDMQERQGGRCACCKQPAKLQIDHDHDTGEVRELICLNCNTALGKQKDSPGVLALSLQYLARHGKALTSEELVSFLELYHPAPQET